MPEPIEIVDRRIRRTVELTHPIEEEYMGEVFLTESKKAHTFELTIERGKEPVPLRGYSVQAFFIAPNRVTHTIDGSVDENTAILTLPKVCYDLEGEYRISIMIVNTDRITPVFHGVGNIHLSTTTNQAAPVTPLPSLTELRGEIAAMRAAAAEANAAAEKSVRYDSDQHLTDAEKLRARNNIDALSVRVDNGLLLFDE